MSQVSKELMTDFLKDPLNIKVLFLMNDISPVDISALEIRGILKNTQNYIVGITHIRRCVAFLNKLNILQISRKIGGVKLYKFNQESEISQTLIELCEIFDDMYSSFMNLPPKPIFVDKKYYEDKKNIPENWKSSYGGL